MMRSASTSPMAGSVFSCSRLALLMSTSGADLAAVGRAFFAADGADAADTAAAPGVTACAAATHAASVTASAQAFSHLDRSSLVTPTPCFFQKEDPAA